VSQCPRRTWVFASAHCSASICDDGTGDHPEKE
jgi:hypothetical protein